MTPTSELLVGRYRLLEVIGQGGMAMVYRARDEVLERDVAVKVLRPGYAADPSFVERFRREARHAASLQHPNIVTIHDTGTDPESGEFIVMNLVDGSDLQSILERGGAQPIGFAVRMGIETARALQAAHDLGIIHRDVKPGNILIDRDGQARVADFGIARAVSDIGATTAGSILGSAQYTSPEQVVGDPVSPRSDIYALGIVLYEALTGVRPFDGTTPAAVALQRLQVEPRPLREVRADIPADLEAIVMRALKRNPDDRYPSAADMGGELERFRIAAVGGVRRGGFSPRAVRPASAAGAALAADAVVDDEDAGDDSGPWAFDDTVVTGRPSTTDSHDPRRRRTPALAILGALGLAAMSLIVLLGTASLFGVGFGEAPERTADPGASDPIVARASTEATGPLLPSPTPLPSPSPAASPSAMPSPFPSPSPEPSPEVTPRPADPPAAGSAGPERDPAETVSSFYDLVERHDFDAAARLWSPRMREEYPPGGNINGRFGPTTRIDIDRLSIRTMDLEAGTAVVDLAITEYRENGDVRRFAGSWDLVLRDGEWLIDEPHF